MLLTAVSTCACEATLFVDILLSKTSQKVYLMAQQKSIERLSKIGWVDNQNAWHMLQGHYVLSDIHLTNLDFSALHQCMVYDQQVDLLFWVDLSIVLKLKKNCKTVKQDQAVLSLQINLF